MNFDKGFGSDNHCGVHPEIMTALNEANVGHAPSYGTDPLSLEAEHLFKELFQHDIEAFFVFNGTAANTLALKAMTRSHHSILCSDVAHAQNDECGAPEFFTGCKLIPVPTINGKIMKAELKKHLLRNGDQHTSQPKVLTITQPTELGTVYSIEELRELCNFAKEHSMLIHIDGARIANAVVSLGCSFQEMVVETGIDVLSFGGTKNGFLFGEAVVFLNRELADDFKYIRKQGLNLPSKSRFIGAQFRRYLTGNLWRDIATHENDMAQKLKKAIQGLPGVEITHPVHANAVFAKIPKVAAKKVRKDFFFYFWNPATFEARLMCSFDTSPEDIHSFAASLKKALDEMA